MEAYELGICIVFTIMLAVYLAVQVTVTQLARRKYRRRIWEREQ